MNIINNTIYNDFNPLPQDLQGWNGTSMVFSNLIDEVKPNLIIEVGTWKGLSAITMAKHIKKSNLNCQIICVDTWLGALEFWSSMKSTPERNLLLKHGYPQIYYQFLSNVIHNNVQDIILPFPNTSLIAARYFANTGNKAQLIYIDASHDEPDVYADIQVYYEILENGGVIFGDDWKHWPGVVAAVRRFSEEMNLNFEIIENNFWILKKP